jgi:hypothetical protein
MVID